VNLDFPAFSLSAADTASSHVAGSVHQQQRIIALPIHCVKALTLSRLCVCAACASGDVLSSQMSDIQASQLYTQHPAAPPVDEMAEELTKNDAWHVITSYFLEKGLVRQQLDRCVSTTRAQAARATPQRGSAAATNQRGGSFC